MSYRTGQATFISVDCWQGHCHIFILWLSEYHTGEKQIQLEFILCIAMNNLCWLTTEDRWPIWRWQGHIKIWRTSILRILEASWASYSSMLSSTQKRYFNVQIQALTWGRVWRYVLDKLFLSASAVPLPFRVLLRDYSPESNPCLDRICKANHNHLEDRFEITSLQLVANCGMFWWRESKLAISASFHLKWQVTFASNSVEKGWLIYLFGSFGQASWKRTPDTIDCEILYHTLQSMSPLHHNALHCMIAIHILHFLLPRPWARDLAKHLRFWIFSTKVLSESVISSTSISDKF